MLPSMRNFALYCAFSLFLFTTLTACPPTDSNDGSDSRPIGDTSGGSTGGTGGDTGSTGGDIIGGDTTAPTFSGASSVNATDIDTLHITWSAASDDQDAVETLHYRVYVATTSGEQDYDVATLETSAGATTADVSDLAEYTEYFVVVRAVDSSDNEDTNSHEVSTLTLDGTAPTFAGATDADAAPNSITLSWAAASDNADDVSDIVYNIYQASTSEGQDFDAPSYVSAAGDTQYAVGDLDTDSTYYFVVRAQDSAGNEDTNTVEVSAATPSDTDTTAPTFAGVTSVGSLALTQATVNWSAATDDISLSSNIVYRVYVASSSGAQNFDTPTVTSNAGATSVILSNLLAATTYYVVVRAQDQAGNRETNSVEVHFTTLSDTTAPTFSSLTSATAASTTSITLSWSAATDNYSAQSAITYLVYQSATSNGFSYTSPAYTTSAGATSYTVTGLTACQKYYFVVRAQDAAGNTAVNTTSRNTYTSTPDDKLSFVNDVYPDVLQAACNDCHTSRNGAFLSGANATAKYETIVGYTIDDCMDAPLVKRGESTWETSFLPYVVMTKNTGAGTCSPNNAGSYANYSVSKMPIGGALTTDQINELKNWISQGACR